MGKFLKDINLKNKVAVVTGATKGIGRATAIALHQVGANIIAIGRNQRELNTLRKKLKTKIKIFSCDVNDYEKIKKIIYGLNRVDILVNNAGTNLPEPFLNVKKSSLETLLNVNTKSAFNMAKLCTDKMLKMRNRKKIGGSIIHTSSMFGLVGGPNRTVYSMTKFGLEGLTKGMSIDLASSNIRVNSVCPTFVATPRAKKYLANKSFKKYALSNIPLGRIATESDVLDKPVIYVGSKTGRDGIHGASMASASFDEKIEEKKPTVQVGDPFTEKLLLEACLELMAGDSIIAIQDMGAAGLTSSSIEMASKGNLGIEINLNKVPCREAKMTPYEIML